MVTNSARKTGRMGVLLERAPGLFENRAVRFVLVAALVGFAAFFLYRDFSHTDWGAVEGSLLGYSLPVLGLALLATALSYGALAAYDVIAVGAVAPGRVGWRLAALAGAAAGAISNLTGHAYIVGAAVRTRFYGQSGFDLAQTVSVAAIAGTGFWLGLAGVLGVLLVAHPEGLFASLGWSRTLDVALGIGLLALVGAIVVLARSGRTVRVWNWTLSLPSRTRVLALLVAGGVDLLGVSLTLYVLMPSDVAGPFPVFFAVFAAAMGLGILSTAPGGLGVFETTLMLGLGAAGRPDAVAALMAYRALYFGLPFLLALAGAGLGWLVLRRAGGRDTLSFNVLSGLVPILCALLVLVAGLVLLVAAVLPSDPGMLAALSSVLPLAALEASHLLSSVLGVLLLVLARALYLRRRRAWIAALVLLVSGAPALLLAGSHWVSAALLVAAALLLAGFGAAFDRGAEAPSGPPPPVLVGGIGAALGLFVWAGLIAYGHDFYAHDLWWAFDWSGDTSRFLRASLMLLLVSAALAFNALLVPAKRPT